MEEDFPDPTDWIQTPVPGLQALETSLRCQVCKELFTAPKVTSCGHTFCSLCIRRCLSTTSKCPICMKTDEEPRLRDNIVVSELVNSFNVIRKSLLETLVSKKEEEEARKQAEEEAQQGAKSRPKAEKRGSYDLDDDEIMEDAEPVHRPRGKRRRQDTTTSRLVREAEPPRRSTRTSSQRTNSKIESSQSIVIPDSDDDDEFQPIEEFSEDDFQSGSRAKRKTASRAPETPTKGSSLIDCPICFQPKDRSKIEAHVNRCIEKKGSPPPTPVRANGASSSTGTPLKRQSVSFANVSKSQHRPPYTAEEREKLRLPKGNSSLAKEADIRKKLRDIGIRCDLKGKDSKQVLWNRLQEWTNFWNANLDSDNPKTKIALIKDLETYEKNQLAQKPSVVQDKGFEREAWSNTHNTNFEHLTANARKTVSQKKENGVETEATKPPLGSVEGRQAGAETELSGIGSPETVEA
ncbi:E3 ubiquitin-protein ligase rad18 [Arthrobotrys musiformis]|uniref:Postreplication repair E3 ubiquitin-protein ligase RAD18 n=1 Tax=Arthrobotrys musiformis TaxID=47236 RepID=A0AAV9W152_9PEZI